MRYDYERFCRTLGEMLGEARDRPVILYGMDMGTEFVRWFLEKYWGRKPKALVGIPSISYGGMHLALKSLHYLAEAGDVVLCPSPLVPDSSMTEVCRAAGARVIPLWHRMYPGVPDCDYPRLTYFDWLKHHAGIDLRGRVYRENGIIQAEHLASDFRTVLDALDSLPCERTSGFLDVGGGKGAAVIAAWSAGFRRIGTIEVDADCFARLRDNLQALGIPNFCHQMGDEAALDEGVACFCGNAAELEKELDRYQVFYMFNPFGEEVMQAFLSQLEKSFARSPRQMYLVYGAPLYHCTVLQHGLFRQLRIMTDGYGGATYWTFIYTTGGDLL